MMRDEERWNTISNNLKVAVEIIHLRRLGEIPYYNRLVEVTGLDKMIVHSELDRLIDVGAMNGSWEKVGDRWVRGFRPGHIEEEFFNLLCDEIYREDTDEPDSGDEEAV